MEDFLNQIPSWIKWIVTVLTGAGGGAGAHKWYQTSLKAEQQEFNQDQKYRDELRGDIDKLRDRQEQYELELAESRSKYFEMQEKYHQLKLDHEEALTENKKMREEIKKLREEIKQLREKLDQNG